MNEFHYVMRDGAWVQVAGPPPRDESLADRVRTSYSSSVTHWISARRESAAFDLQLLSDQLLGRVQRR